MVLWDGGGQYGALRQGGDAVNPNRSTGATSRVMPASNGNSTQFSGNTLIGLTNDPENSGITGSISLAAQSKFIIKY